MLGIKYENAKAIYRTYRLPYSVTKVKFRKHRQNQIPITFNEKVEEDSPKFIEYFDQKGEE